MWSEVEESGEGGGSATGGGTGDQPGNTLGGEGGESHPFLGEHTHSLDAKGRIILPARYRQRLAVAYVTSEQDGCLALWPPAEFHSRAREMKEHLRGGPDDRAMARAFFAGAEEANPDQQGRIAIPVHLREFARLEKEVALTGAYDHVEIWDAAAWREKMTAGELSLAGVRSQD